MADWRKIKTEYITTDTSYRKLCEKYDVPLPTLRDRAKSEKWVEARTQYRDKAVTKATDAIIDKQAERASRLQSVADRLLTKVERLMDMDDKVIKDSDGENMVLGSKGMKSIAGVLKDIKEIQMIRSDADLEEQKARIAKLRREAEEENEPPEIKVTLAKAEEYAK